MRFIVIENFSEAVDPKARRKRLAGVLKAARKSVNKANAGNPQRGYRSVPGGDQWHKTSRRMWNIEDKRRAHLDKASKALSIYKKKRKGGDDKKNWGVDRGYRRGYTKTDRYGRTSPRTRIYKAKFRKGSKGEVT